MTTLQPIEFGTSEFTCQFWIETRTAHYKVTIVAGETTPHYTRNCRYVAPNDPDLGVARKNFARIDALLAKIRPAIDRYLSMADDTRERRELWWNLKNAARNPESTPTLTPYPAGWQFAETSIGEVS